MCLNLSLLKNYISLGGNKMPTEYQLYHPNSLSNQLKQLREAEGLIDRWQKLSNQQDERIRELEEQNRQLVDLLKRSINLLEKSYE